MTADFGDPAWGSFHYSTDVEIHFIYFNFEHFQLEKIKKVITNAMTCNAKFTIYADMEMPDSCAFGCDSVNLRASATKL
jgi:hypothetical protein